jgi:hypothetical protein
MKKRFLKDNRLQKSEIEELENKMQQARNQNDYSGEKKLKHRLKYLYMKARNEKVKEDFQKVHAEKTNGNKLEVFCVGNALYNKAVETRDIQGIQASNIATLRNRCQLIAVESKLSESRNFLYAKLPGLLESIQVWLDALSTRVQGKDFEAIETQISGFQLALYEQLGLLQKELTTLFQEQIGMMVDQRAHIWNNQAIEKHEVWKSVSLESLQKKRQVQIVSCDLVYTL